MSEYPCTCYCGGEMFYRHMHAESCPLSMHGEPAPETEVDVLRGQVADLTQRLAAVEQRVQELKRIIGLDCGDHSCLYAVNRSGMRTNGGCRCKPESLQARLAALEVALQLYKQASYQSHSGHWDMTGQSGGGCPECIRARELREQAEAALLAGKGEDDVSENMSQYVIIRQNCESFVAWGRTKEEAILDFESKGHSRSDIWKCLKK